jgi:TolA-binding protein/predicted Ser/Thr protein kinase
MVGKTISHYRVLARIGEGASGVVYRAEDLALGRGVALKFVTPDQSWDASAMLRFQHEARMASSLNHPNICTIYEIGEHQGSQFIAMELLEGVTLSQAIAGEPLPVMDLLSIAIQICDGLHAAHIENVIHRDLKPVNVFVTTRNQVKILDFALAQFNPARAPVEPSTATVWGPSASGTVPYMSPEQINRTAVDARSDLFSLGIIMYEMATGRRAFNGQSMREIQEAILREVLPEPRVLNPAVPHELDRIIIKALEKNRELRYQTASDLRADLRRLQRDLESQGAPRPKVQPAKMAGGRSWELGRYAAGIAVAVGLVLFGAVTLRYGREMATRTSAPVAQPVPATPSSVTVAQPPPPAQPAAVGQPATVSQPAAVSQPARAAKPAPVAQPSSVAQPGSVAQPFRAVGSSLPPPGSAAEDLRVAQTMIGSGLQEQAAAKLAELVADHPGTKEALDGYFLAAGIQEKQNRPNDAMATYLEVAERFKGNPRAAEALYRVAHLTLQSKRPGKEEEARKTLEGLVRQYAKTSWAAVALLEKGELEEARDLRAAISSYGQIGRDYPKSDVHAVALTRLAGLYEKQKLYGPAATTYVQLAKSHPENADEAWYRAAELYRRRLNNPAIARDAYAKVSAGSKYFADAQKGLKE